MILPIRGIYLAIADLPKTQIRDFVLFIGLNYMYFNIMNSLKMSI